MKSNRIKFIGAALVVTLLVAITAVSETSGRHGHHAGRDGMFGGPGFGFIVHRLDLTDAQKAQAKQIMSNEKSAFQPLMQQMRQNRAQERQLVEAANFDEAQAQALASQQAKTIAELSVQKMRVESQLYQILTPDQKTKLNDILDKRAQRFQQRQQGQQPDQQQQPANQ